MEMVELVEGKCNRITTKVWSEARVKVEGISAVEERRQNEMLDER